MTNATDQTFSELVRKGTTLAVFSAHWCGPCRLLHPRIAAFAAKTGLSVVEVDIDECPKLVQAYALKKVPTVILFKTGIEKRRREGLMSESDLVGLVQER